jgi:hypothetical protein
LESDDILAKDNLRNILRPATGFLTFIGAKPLAQATRQDVQGYRYAFTRTGPAIRHSTFHHWSGSWHSGEDRPAPKRLRTAISAYRIELRASEA